MRARATTAREGITRSARPAGRGSSAASDVYKRQLLKAGVGAFRALEVPEDRGLALGFVAGAVGLLGHAIGANTFIIVRIMEPFWFFAAIVVALPGLAQEEKLPLPATPARLAGRFA